MTYLNLRNEPETGNRVAITMSSDTDLLKKKESYWFLALVVALIVIGSIVFYSAHTGGEAEYYIRQIIMFTID